MKMRTGFVSNSSSSSFIVTEKITTARLARSMIDIIEADYRNDDEDKGAEWYPLAVEWLDANPEYDGPIVIPWSINYDTFIVRLDKDITVETCNNHGWWDLPFDMTPEHPDTSYEEWKPQSKDMLFMDLSILAVVRRSEYLDLWERRNEDED